MEIVDLTETSYLVRQCCSNCLLGSKQSGSSKFNDENSCLIFHKLTVKLQKNKKITRICIKIVGFLICKFFLALLKLAISILDFMKRSDPIR